MFDNKSTTEYETVSPDTHVSEETALQYDSGIEYESENFESSESDPFDPEEISIDTKPVPMETVLRRIEQKSIILNPDFQRNEVWDDERKSRLIESLMLRIPLPMFYVAADTRNNWTVVDGLQRISAFRDFVLGRRYLMDSAGQSEEKGNGFRLKGLEFWKDYEGKTMKELPVHLYNRILESTFQFTIINPGTHEEVKRNIFKRINTGGLPLSAQEIRNALYTGPATELLKELSESEAFRNATCNSIRAKRMEDQELVLRFIAFLLRPYTNYRRTLIIDTWLSDTMIILNSLPNLSNREFLKAEKERTIRRDDINVMSMDEIKRFFELGMERASMLFGKHAFRKSIGDMKRAPVNKSLFETWGVILSQLDEDAFRIVLNDKITLYHKYSEVLEDKRFQIDISRDSMRHLSVSNRFDTVSRLIDDTISF